VAPNPSSPPPLARGEGGVVIFTQFLHTQAALAAFLRGVGVAATLNIGLPVRREIARVPRAQARAALGLDPNQKVLVILGGSQGASVLNDWARSNLPLFAAEGIQVVCVTGLGKGEPETRATAWNDLLVSLI